jgi:hypothetical protein
MKRALCVARAPMSPMFQLAPNAAYVVLVFSHWWETVVFGFDGTDYFFCICTCFDRIFAKPLGSWRCVCLLRLFRCHKEYACELFPRYNGPT